MLKIKAVYIGNELESYIQDGFTSGLNIITSAENHVGKTIVMQSMMYALGADAKFPPSFKDKQYLFIIDIDVDGREISILRNRDNFVVKEGDKITPLEGKGAFDEYWCGNISQLPTIIKDGSPVLAGLSLYTQMAFVPQADRTTSNTLGGYFRKGDFAEMVFALHGLAARQIDGETEIELKRKRDVLKARERELSRQAAALRKAGDSLAMVSPTADREETLRFVGKLDELKDEILNLKKQRNHAYTRMKKNESVLGELRSLNREVQLGSVVCLNCGSESIGYKMPGSEFVFDVTTPDMRSQILRSVQDCIDAYREEVAELDKEIRAAQRKFNELANSREVTLEDIYAAREDYGTLEDVDGQLTSVRDEIEGIEKRLRDSTQVDKELSEGRKAYKDSLLDTMNRIRRSLNEDPDAEEYNDLFTPANSPHMGSEATEFFLARIYSLAIHTNHGMPILIDSFRAEELSTSREERALPYFINLPNQVIFTATLKGQEAGKYSNEPSINNIDYTGYKINKLLSDEDNEAFAAKVKSFGIRLDG